MKELTLEQKIVKRLAAMGYITKVGAVATASGQAAVLYSILNISTNSLNQSKFSNDFLTFKYVVKVVKLYYRSVYFLKKL